MYMLFALSIVLTVTAYNCMNEEANITETVQRLTLNVGFGAALYSFIGYVIPDIIARLTG